MPPRGLLSPKDKELIAIGASIGACCQSCTAHHVDAAREAQRSINSFGGWAIPWTTLGVASAALGQLDTARKAAEVAARLDRNINPDGYAKFFRFIVRNDDLAAQIHGWLQQIWPAA